jgi:hypothetical protein
MDASGQESDLRMWTSATVSKDLFKKLNLSLTEEARFENNISRFDQMVSEVNLKYSIIKGVKARVTYRYTNVNSLANGWYNRQRFACALMFDTDIQRFNVSLRPEYQLDYKGFVNEDKDMLTIKHLRTKLELQYNINKTPLMPYAYYELFYYFNAFGNDFFDAERFALGASYKINKHNEFDLYYMIEKEINLPNPKTGYTIGIAYKYDF